MGNGNIWKRYFLVSLIFNLAVLGTFLFFTVKSVLNDHQKEYRYPLSETQQTELNHLDSTMNREVFPVRMDVIKTRLELWDGLMDANLDTGLVEQRMNELIDSEINLKMLRYRYYLQEKFLLTPEQRRERLQRPYQNLKKYYLEHRAQN